MNLLYRFASCIGLALLASAAQGAITFVDATPNYDPTDSNFNASSIGNTTVNGALVLTSGVSKNVDRSSSSTGLPTDGLWQYRFNLTVNGNALWQTDNSSTAGETTAPLVTTIALPGAGTYRLHATLYSQGDATGLDNTKWDLAARVGSTGPFVSYVDAAPNTGMTLTTVTGTEFSSPTITRQGATVEVPDSVTKMWLCNLGIFTFNEAEAAAVQIYIDGPDRGTVGSTGQTNFGERTWYEGVGYEAVLLGDFDSDGDVDGADFIAWQTNHPLESGATLAQGDADGDLDVDGADFAAWQNHFPTTPGPGFSPVPEPISIQMILIGVILSGSVLHLKRRR
jgi:hypothetical protein